MAKVVVIGALPESLNLFRGELIRTMVAAGHCVTAMAAQANAGQVQVIESLGAHFCSYPVERSGLNPFRDFQTLWALCKVLRELSPDVVLAYTIKPVIWSGLAIFFTKRPRFYALIEGLGYAFQGGNWRRCLVGLLATLLYRLSLKRADKVIFLNPDDKKFFLERNIVKKITTALIDGIGLDLAWYSFQKLPEGEPVFLCIARLLGEKGLREFAHAARLVKERYPNAIFRLLGPTDSLSPDGISLQEIQCWHDQEVVEYLGTTHDVRSFIAKCHVFVLPSFYGEGLPRTIIEAAAMGRPILTTDNVGCRDTVVPGKNGFLVPVRDSKALAKCMIWFIEHREQWPRMGQASRRMAEERFDVHKINQHMMQIMNLDEEREKNLKTKV